MRGKWALGIPPRHFTWVLKNKIAICERPGGYGTNHRRVRRQEEIIWIREQRFNCVISLSPLPHNLHNYDELGVPWRHRPFNGADDGPDYLQALFEETRRFVQANHKLILHREELGDHVIGFMAGYLLWAGLVASGPQVTTIIEHITQRQLGPTGREIVTLAGNLRRADPLAADAMAEEGSGLSLPAVNGEVS